MTRDRKWLEPYKPYASLITPGARENATEVVFLNSRYLFTERMGKKQWAYCTHCHGAHPPEQTLKHNSVAMCPHCYSACIVKASGRGHLHMIDQTYFLYYDKAPNNPDAIVARGIHAIRDYSGDYRKVETEYYVLAYYVFEPGHAAMMRDRYGVWEVCATVYTLPKYFSAFPSTVSRDSIKTAVTGTQFRYSTWEQYNNMDMTKFFALAARYKCVEYLTKLGCSNLVTGKLENADTWGGINWRGKNVLKVLRLTKQELNEIRRQQVKVDYGFLEILKRVKAAGWDLAVQDAVSLASGFNSPYNFESFQEFLAHALIKTIPVKKVLHYLDKQYARDKEHYGSLHNVAITWRDYLEDAKRARMDLKSDNVLYPKSVYNIHQNMIMQAHIKADTKLNGMIANRLEDLAKKYCFERDSLFIRPAKDTLELIKEGQDLNHCVGRYGDSYAHGKTDILFLRKAEEPDKPYFTVEVRPGDKQVFQMQGRNRRTTGQDVDEFIKAFTTEKLAKKEKKGQERIRIPA